MRSDNSYASVFFIDCIGVYFWLIAFQVHVFNIPWEDHKRTTIIGVFLVVYELNHLSVSNGRINPHSTRQKYSHFYLLWDPQKPKCVSLTFSVLSFFQEIGYVSRTWSSKWVLYALPVDSYGHTALKGLKAVPDRCPPSRF